MVIYGTALLAACYLAGIAVGEGIAVLIGVKANVGGVGIAMLFLIVAQHYLQKRGLFHIDTAKGVTFWAMLYIPVVVAMAATQNVVAAVKAGPLVLIAGTGAVILCFSAVAIISRIGPRGETMDEIEAREAREKQAADRDLVRA